MKGPLQDNTHTIYILYLLADELAEELLVGRAQIVKVAKGDASLAEHGDSLGPLEAEAVGGGRAFRLRRNKKDMNPTEEK